MADRRGPTARSRSRHGIVSSSIADQAQQPSPHTNFPTLSKLVVLPDHERAAAALKKGKVLCCWGMLSDHSSPSHRCITVTAAEARRSSLEFALTSLKRVYKKATKHHNERANVHIELQETQCIGFKRAPLEVSAQVKKNAALFAAMHRAEKTSAKRNEWLNKARVPFAGSFHSNYTYVERAHWSTTELST
jgi:hypothetical protein